MTGCKVFVGSCSDLGYDRILAFTKFGVPGVDDTNVIPDILFISTVQLVSSHHISVEAGV